MALDVLKQVSELNEMLSPLETVCDALKVVVDTAEVSHIDTKSPVLTVHPERPKERRRSKESHRRTESTVALYSG